MLNLFWEKLPESVFYDALCQTMLTLDYELTDYTATEDVNMRGIGKGLACVYVKMKCYENNCLLSILFRIVVMKLSKFRYNQIIHNI